MSPRAAARLESMGFRDVYDYEPGKQNWLASGLPTEGKYAGIPRAGALAREDAPTASLQERLGDLRQRVERAGWDVAVVVNEEGVVLGILRPRNLGQDAELRVEEAMSPGPSTFRPHVFVTEMAEYMTRHDMPSAPVTTGDGVLIGILRREDAVEAARELHRHHQDHDG
jgi:CBS domain-containing protein